MVLHLNVPVHQELVVCLQLRLNLFILDGLVFKIEMHVCDMFSKAFFDLSHSKSPYTSSVIDFRNGAEIN